MDINSTLVETIDYIVSQRINDLPIDKTVIGTIESKNEDGTYSILEGSLRFAALGNGQNYRSGQQVLVLIPGGDYSNSNKVILGLKNAMATSEQLMPYVRPRDKMIHVDEKGIKGLIEGQIYRNIENYYRRCNCVSVSANVKTDFAHNITEGSYGLLVYILDGEKIVEILDLNNKKDMFGNTFKFVTALPQEVTYSVDLSGVSLNGLGVKYETYIGDLYYINDNNQKVLYHPTGEEITFSNIVVSFGFDTTQKPVKELDFLLKDADTLQLLWYNVDASGKSLGFTDGDEFNLDYAINYKRYQEQINEILILEDYSALTDEEQALFKKLYNPEEGKETEVFDQLRKGEYKGVNPFDDIYYGIEWKITNKKESGLWKTFETNGEIKEVKPRQDKWQNTYVKAIVYRNGEIFEKVYDGVFENLIVTETSEDGHIYYTGIKLIHDQSSRPHYDCYGYTNLVINSEDMITRKIKWSSILNEEYSIEEPPKLQPIGVYWYVPTNNTMLVPIGEKNKEKPMAGYDCYKADVFDYKIKSHFAPYDKNNTLKCRLYLDEINYYEAELTFSFTTKGTMGTDYSLIIKEKNDRYAATAPNDASLNFDSSFVRDPDGNKVEEADISIDTTTYPGIVEVGATFGDNKLIAYQPIALNTSGETVYYQGPTEVVYDAFGMNPRYDKTEPKLIDIEGKQIDDIYWSYSSPIPDAYSSNENYQVIILTAKRNEVTIWQQPLFLFQDLYGNSYLNKWDGKLKVDESTGRVLASMIGAGHKTNNLFTGVLMGDVETPTPTNEEPNKMTRETGLFGYSAGVQTFGVKTDGTAFLGNKNGGIQFRGDNGEIRNVDGSILIDFSSNEGSANEEQINIKLNVPYYFSGTRKFHYQGQVGDKIILNKDENNFILLVENNLSYTTFNEVIECKILNENDSLQSAARTITYIDTAEAGSKFQYKNGKIFFNTDNLDIRSSNVQFDNGAFIIESPSRKISTSENMKSKPEILSITDDSYILRSKDFEEQISETTRREFNIVINVQDTEDGPYLKKWQDYSTKFFISELAKTQQGIAFKTDNLYDTNIAEDTLKIKSSGESDIILTEKGCNPPGNWIKAYIYDKTLIKKDKNGILYYEGDLQTVYRYPGNDGKRLKKVVSGDNSTKIIEKRKTVSEGGGSGAEIDLNKSLLKFFPNGTRIFIGQPIPDTPATKSIYIGGDSKYALCIGAFKVDWEGNVYVGNSLIHSVPVTTTEE